jgi:hypothetical protein
MERTISEIVDASDLPFSISTSPLRLGHSLLFIYLFIYSLIIGSKWPFSLFINNISIDVIDGVADFLTVLASHRRCGRCRFQGHGQPRLG